jgi:hypothetical protein
MGFHEVPWNFMRFYDVLVNRSVPTEANRGLTSYIAEQQRLSLQQEVELCLYIEDLTKQGLPPT